MCVCMCVGEQGVCENSLYCPLIFTVNLTTALKNSLLIFKSTVSKIKTFIFTLLVRYNSHSVGKVNKTFGGL